MSDLEAARRRLNELRVTLDQAAEGASVDRVALRDGIVGLFREVESTIAEYQALRESIRPLVERYQQIFPRGGAAGATAAPARVDHLGSSTFRERGWNALAGGDYERAVKELRRALELDPDHAGNLALLAWAHLRLDDLEGAVPYLDAALANDPEHAIAGVCDGYRRIAEGRLDDAVEALSAFVSEGAEPTARLYANFYLGMAHARSGRHREAQAWFRRSIELGPNLTEAYWELGRSHHDDGRDDLALEAWRAGGENRFNPWGERCREAADRLSAAGE